jgi:hypothetical protein
LRVTAALLCVCVFVCVRACVLWWRPWLLRAAAPVSGAWRPRGARGYGGDDELPAGPDEEQADPTPHLPTRSPPQGGQSRADALDCRDPDLRHELPKTSPIPPKPPAGIGRRAALERHPFPKHTTHPLNHQHTARYTLKGGGRGVARRGGGGELAPTLWAWSSLPPRAEGEPSLKSHPIPKAGT